MTRCHTPTSVFLAVVVVVVVVGAGGGGGGGGGSRASGNERLAEGEGREKSKMFNHGAVTAFICSRRKRL